VSAECKHHSYNPIDNGQECHSCVIERLTADLESNEASYQAQLENITAHVESLTAEVTRLTAESKLHRARILGANEVLRSAMAIASRKGADTRWLPFKGRLKLILESQHKYLYQTPDSGSQATPLQDLFPKPGEKCSGPARARLRKAQKDSADSTQTPEREQDVTILGFPFKVIAGAPDDCIIFIHKGSFVGRIEFDLAAAEKGRK